jgi:hypothetical protein
VIFLFPSLFDGATSSPATVHFDSAFGTDDDRIFGGYVSARVLTLISQGDTSQIKTTGSN